MKTPKELFLSPSDLSKPCTTGTDMYGKPMDVYHDLCAWSSPPNGVIEGCRYTDISQLWHSGEEEPELYAPCLLEVTFHFDDMEPISDFITSDWGKYGWSEEHIARDAVDTTVHRWAYIHSLRGGII